MKIFLDSSNLGEIQKWNSVIDGLTTNPSILKKDGHSEEVYTEISRLLSDRPISIQLEEETFDALIEAAALWREEIPNAVFKITLLDPEGSDHMDIISELVEKGFVINCTALLSLGQVMLATKCGAQFVSLFVGRIDDEGGDIRRVVRDCIDFLGSYPETQLIVGSIRTVGNVRDSMQGGAHIATITPPVLEKMLMHRFSLDTVRQFSEDAKRLKRDG